MTSGVAHVVAVLLNELFSDSVPLLFLSKRVATGDRGTEQGYLFVVDTDDRRRGSCNGMEQVFFLHLWNNKK
ncbi:hypothetical protein [Aquimarina macrocephali]|uniref:hypothetical protein n=1 Tax=Aquimarina macrocephali TaxID=666563 RepID=UPI003F675CB6